jgi:hypothetical protein
MFPSLLLDFIVQSRRETYDVKVITELRVYLANKRPSTWVYQNLHKTACEFMTKEYPRFKEMWPDIWTREMERHVDVAWLEFLRSSATRLADIANLGGTHYANLRAEARKIDNPEEPSYSWILRLIGYTLLFVAAYCALRQVKATVASLCRGFTVTSSLAVPKMMSVLTNAVSKLSAVRPTAAILKCLTYGQVWGHVMPQQGQLVHHLCRPWDGMTNLLRKLPGLQNMSSVCGVIVEEALNTTFIGRCLNAVAEIYAGKPVAAAWHVVSAVVPWWVRLPTHLVWNLLQKRAQPMGDLWRAWKRNFHDQGVPFTTEEPSDVGCDHFTPRDAWIPRRVAPLVQRHKPLCPLLRVHMDQTMYDDLAQRGADTLYVFPTNVPLYAASNNGAMLATALRERLLAAHPAWREQQQAFSRRMAELEFLLPPPGYFSEIPERDPELLHAWLAHFDETKRRQMADTARLVERVRPTASHRAYNGVSIVIKLDEHLVRPTGEFKPRTIASVDPIVQVDIGPSLRVATARLHRWWCGDPYDTPYTLTTSLFSRRGVIRFAPAFAVGWEDQRMGDWVNDMSHAPADVIGVMVVGDDSVVTITTQTRAGTPRTRYLCADFSSFDQTQGDQALEWGHIVLARMGITVGQISRLKRLSRAPYFARAPRGGASAKIERVNRAMRDTGGPDTTIGNSSVNVAAWALVRAHLLCWAYEADLREEAGLPRETAFIENAMRNIGFDIKVKCFDSITELEFLKGAFYPISGSRHWTWAPLPSRFLKVGKSMRDPRQVYGIANLEEAAVHHMKAVAASYQRYTAVPLMRAFVRRFFDPSVAPTHRQLAYMVTGTGAQIDEEAMWASLEHRYGYSRAQFEMVEQWIATEPPFTFMQHPLFFALARDYA